MGKRPLEFAPPGGRVDFENLSVEYRMKLIAYQDEIFRAKKKLQESDVRMTELQNKLDNYLRNKENQLAEVMFTAHTNAQRIEAQARSQVQYFLDEMDLELQRKQMEIGIIEEKTSRFDKALVTPSEPLLDAEKASPLKMVESDDAEIEPTGKIEKLDVQPEESLPTAKKKEKVLLQKSRPSQPAETEDNVAVPAKLPKLQVEDGAAPLSESEPPVTDEIGADVQAETVAIVETEETSVTPAIATEEVIGPAAAETIETEAQAIIAFEPLDEEPLAAVGMDSPAEQIEALEGLPTAAEAEPFQEAAEKRSPEALEEYGREGLASEAEMDVEPEAELESELGLEPELAVESEAELEPEREPEPEPVAAPPAAQQIEISERMQLDAFIDVRYFSEISGTRELYHHALQITIEVDVPADNYSVRYTKVSSDVVSTLMKFDNVVLNDIYPFNFVAPNPNSIATYFFNLLDDMLQIMDLGLYKMTMTEFPDMCIVVDKRNTAFDNMLHKGEDLFENIRKSLPACVEAEPRESSALKGTLSKLLKKRI